MVNSNDAPEPKPNRCGSHRIGPFAGLSVPPGPPDARYD